MRRLLLLVVTLTSICFGQASSQTNEDRNVPAKKKSSLLTVGLVNGRFWEAFPEMSKGIYIAGVRDSIMAAAIMNTTPRANEVHWAGSFTVEDYTKELDALYKDRENIRIPVVFGVEYVTYKLRGDKTKQDVEGFLLKLRRWASELE